MAEWLDWLASPRLLWLVGGYLASAVLSLGLAGAVVVLLPAEYFRNAGRRPRPGRPAVSLAGRIARNLIGVVLVAAGVILALPGMPGQGLVTLVLGLMLLDIPGRRRLARRLLGRGAVLSRLNRLRARFGRPPLRL